MLFTPFTFIYFKCYGVREKNQGKNHDGRVLTRCESGYRGEYVVTGVNNGCVNALSGIARR